MDLRRDGGRFHSANNTVIQVAPRSIAPSIPAEVQSLIYSFVSPLDLVQFNSRLHFLKYVNDDEDLWSLLRMFRDIPELFTVDGPWKWLQNTTLPGNGYLAGYPMYCDWEGIDCFRKKNASSTFKYDVSLSIQNPHKIRWSEIPKLMHQIKIHETVTPSPSNNNNETISKVFPLIDFREIDPENKLSRITVNVERGDFAFNGKRTMKNLRSISLNTSRGNVLDYKQFWESVTFAHFIRVIQEDAMKLSDFKHFRCLKQIEIFTGKWNSSLSERDINRYLPRPLYGVHCCDEEVMVWTRGWVVACTVAPLLWIQFLVIVVLVLMIRFSP